MAIENVLDDNARLHRYALIAFWIKQGTLQRWLQAVYSSDRSSRDYRTSHALK